MHFTRYYESGYVKIFILVKIITRKLEKLKMHI